MGHLLAYEETSVLGTVLVFFSALVTLGVAAYLYNQFRSYKRLNERDRVDPTFQLEGGETEFEIAQDVDLEAGKQSETAALVRNTSDDDFFFDDEEETGR